VITLNMNEGRGKEKGIMKGSVFRKTCEEENASSRESAGWQSEHRQFARACYRICIEKMWVDLFIPEVVGD